MIVVATLSALLLLAGCHGSSDDPLRGAVEGITCEGLERDIVALSSDRMQGRAPFGEGEKLTVDYLEARMKEIGLTPAFGDSYRQPVPMVRVTSSCPDSLTLSTPKGPLGIARSSDYSLWSSTTQDIVRISDAPLLFVGFGITAPEYDWNDLEGVDCKGKILVMLVNDPGYYTGDSASFRGRAMTYHGRWTYKFQQAETYGAVGCILIHEDGPAGYPWAVVNNHNNAPMLYLDEPVMAAKQSLVNGWITRPCAERVLASAGLKYEDLLKRATQPGFKPVELGIKLSMEVENHVESFTSQNVGGMIRGDSLPDQTLIYTAHWDHLGVGKAIEGDSIYNGASDNAAAMAWLLAIAEGYMRLPAAPMRSVLFLLPTAEEAGMFGSAYFAQQPSVDLRQAVATINNDVILLLGRFKDVTLTGAGHSDLDSLVEAKASLQGRYVAYDPNPENGMFYRSDQLPLMRKGVPAIFAKGYTHQAELGKEETLRRVEEYWANVYHKPCDEYAPTRDRLEGLQEDAQLFLMVGHELVNSRMVPRWKRSSEFFVER